MSKTKDYPIGGHVLDEGRRNTSALGQFFSSPNRESKNRAHL